MPEYHPNAVAATPLSEDIHIQEGVSSDRKWPARLGGALLIGVIAAAGGKYVQDRIEESTPGCQAEIIVNSDSYRVLHLPDGTMVQTVARTSGLGMTIVIGGDAQTLTDEQVNSRPSLVFDVTHDTAVRAAVTPTVVTTSCVQIDASK